MATYIRNRDKSKFAKTNYSKTSGVVLTKYYGTVKDAKRKGIPLFNPNGTRR